MPVPKFAENYAHVTILIDHCIGVVLTCVM